MPQDFLLLRLRSLGLCKVYIFPFQITREAETGSQYFLLYLLIWYRMNKARFSMNLQLSKKSCNRFKKDVNYIFLLHITYFCRSIIHIVMIYLLIKFKDLWSYCVSLSSYYPGSGLFQVCYDWVFSLVPLFV